MKILVTGGAGFIGSNLVDNLLMLGHEVVCLDNFDPFYPRSIKEKNIEKANNNKNIIFYEGDIRDIGFLDKIFKEQNIELVYHLAAKAGVRPSIIDPVSYYDVNVNGTLYLLECMRKYGVKKLLFASSSSVYGNNPKTPFSEEDIVDNPISPYAASKKAGELLCHTYHHLYGFDIFCFRFFTVYGPRQRPDLAIHKFTNSIMDGKEIEMYGEGTTSRDYTYIDDILHGLLSAIEKLSGYEIINLGESRTITLSEMIKVLHLALNAKLKIKKLPLQPGDVEITYADIQKAKKLLGYNPKWKFEDGINQFIKWKIS